MADVDCSGDSSSNECMHGKICRRHVLLAITPRGHTLFMYKDHNKSHEEGNHGFLLNLRKIQLQKLKKHEEFEWKCHALRKHVSLFGLIPSSANQHHQSNPSHIHAILRNVSILFFLEAALLYAIVGCREKYRETY